jgi:hypothetical protein
VEDTFAKETFGFLANENNSGKVNFKGGLFQQSSQKRRVEPSATTTEAKPLNLSKSFRISLHQKEPFLT